MKNIHYKGMTLVELMLYLALLSVLMNALLKTSIALSGDMERRRISTQRDLNSMIASEKAKRQSQTSSSSRQIGS